MTQPAQPDNSQQPQQDKAAIIEQLAQVTFAQLQHRTIAAGPATAPTTAGAQADATDSTLPDLSAEPEPLRGFLEEFYRENPSLRNLDVELVKDYLLTLTQRS